MHHRRLSCWSDKCFTLIYVQNACFGLHTNEEYVGTQRPPTFTKNSRFQFPNYILHLCVFCPGYFGFLTHTCLLWLGWWHSLQPGNRYRYQIDGKISLHHANVIQNKLHNGPHVNLFNDWIWWQRLNSNTHTSTSCRTCVHKQAKQYVKCTSISANTTHRSIELLTISLWQTIENGIGETQKRNNLSKHIFTVYVNLFSWKIAYFVF